MVLGRPNFQFTAGYESSTWIAPQIYDGELDITPTSQQSASRHFDFGAAKNKDLSLPGSGNSSLKFEDLQKSIPRSPSNSVSSEAKNGMLKLSYVDETNRVTLKQTASGRSDRGRTQIGYARARSEERNPRTEIRSPDKARKLRSLSNQSRLLKPTASSMSKRNVTTFETKETRGYKSPSSNISQSIENVTNPTRRSTEKMQQKMDQWDDPTLVEVLDKLDAPDVLSIFEQREAQLEKKEINEGMIWCKEV